MHRTPEDGFFLDIRDRPDDDLPRLVYADWLDDTGGPVERLRAELIRLQCRLARLPADETRSVVDEHREQDLLDLLDDWLQPLRAVSASLVVRRGLVEEVEANSEQLLTHGDRIAQLAPVAEISLTVSAAEWEPIMDCPHLRRVTRLEQRGGGLGDAGARQLADSPHVGRLRSLELHQCGITEAGFADLLRLDLSRLTVLNLGANDLRDAGVELLCQAPPLAGLELLSLGANDLHLPSAEALAASPYLRRLRDVNLGANYLEDDAIRLLAQAPHLAGLSRLDVRSNEFHARGAFALARSPHLGGLEFLDVSGNRIVGRARGALLERFGHRVQF